MEIRPKTLPYLTQAAEVADNKRFYGTRVFTHSSQPGKWREASQEERDAWAERVKEMKEKKRRDAVAK
jgi:hypothetical protein